MSEAEKKEKIEKAYAKYEAIQGARYRSQREVFIYSAEFGYQLAQEEFKQSNEPIKLYAKDQSQQGQNPTDPKESGEVEKPVVSMYDPPAEITYIQVNGKEYVPIDPNQDELWNEVGSLSTGDESEGNPNFTWYPNLLAILKKRYRITRI